MNSSAWLVWLLLGLPLSCGAALGVAGRRANRVAPGAAAVVTAMALAVTCAAAAVRPTASLPLFSGISAGVSVDGLSAVMAITVLAVTLAVVVFSAGEFDDNENRGRFFGLLLVFAGAMLVTVTATGLALLLMGWEVMGAASWALIGYWWQEPRRLHAANTAFLTTRAADLGLYVAAGAATAGGIGGLELAGLAGAGSPWLSVITIGIVLAAFGKSAQLPFSFWLSQAMEGPSPVSALLHSATMVAAGAYLLLRLRPLLVASGWGAPAVAWVGAATALLLGLVAVAQVDLKQLLAASTCAQIGFMVLAAGAGGVAGGVMQLVAHAAVKSLLFLAAGAWLAALGTKSLSGLKGAARSHRLVGIAFTVGALALAGLPPWSLWVTKDEVLAAALHEGPALYAVGLCAAIVSAVYSVKALWFVWQPIPEDAAAGYDTEQHGTRRIPFSMKPPMVALAVLAASLGVLALPAIGDPLRRTLGAVGEATSRSWELALSASAAVAAAGLTWWWGGRPLPAAPLTARLEQWLDLERIAHAVVVGPVLRLAAALATFDDAVVDRIVCAMGTGALRLAKLVATFDDSALDGAVRGVARGGSLAGGVAARVDDGGVDRLVTAIVGTTRRLARLARRPQTGQVHAYYAQAAIALVALAVFFALVR
jgi:NADH:ubiquinone oxidoreductase subunit 5 (subunit L)/multisubunit Na+/H+ antiporter MnhA subunit